jgi:nitroreductase
MEQIRPISKALTGAPACIVILVDPKATPRGEFYVQDASAAMENMLLAAVGLGYGACWIEGAVRRAEGQLRQLLGVPQDLRVWSLMPVGRPAALPPRPPKLDQRQITHYNRFGQSG